MYLRPHPRIVLQHPHPLCSDTNPPVWSSRPKTMRTVAVEDSRAGGSAMSALAKLRKVTRRQSAMRSANGGQKQFGQLTRVLICRIVFAPKFTQRLTHNFTRVGIAASPSFRDNVFLQIFCQRNFHGFNFLALTQHCKRHDESNQSLHASLNFTSKSLLSTASPTCTGI